MKIEKPLCEAIFNYEKAKVYPLHTPGHKGGRGMDESLLAAIGKRAAAIDVSLMSELDDLHCPEGCLRAAQKLAAELYGSDQCFFAVNGTTEQAKRDMAEFMIAALSVVVDVFEKQEGKRNV